MEINGTQVILIRKKIKNIHLYVKAPDGRIEVTAPLKAKDEIIFSFVESKKDWIIKQQKKIRNSSENQIRNYESGEEAAVFGEKYKLIIQKNQNENSVRIFDNCLILNVKNENVDREKLLDDFYRRKLSEKIPDIINDFEKITGLHPSSWSIRKMKTRWGTCNVKTKKIWLSLMLAQKPAACIEYVVLHELIHLAVPNHGSEFKAYLDKYMPDWRYRKNFINGENS